MSIVIKTKKRQIHCIAHCNDCSFSEGWYRTAARRANTHAKKTGHRVSIEQGISYDVYGADGVIPNNNATIFEAIN